jgi:hypothetical protein
LADLHILVELVPAGFKIGESLGKKLCSLLIWSTLFRYVRFVHTCYEIFPVPEAVWHAGGHRRAHAKRLVNAYEIIERKVER